MICEKQEDGTFRVNTWDKEWVIGKAALDAGPPTTLDPAHWILTVRVANGTAQYRVLEEFAVFGVPTYRLWLMEGYLLDANGWMRRVYV